MPGFRRKKTSRNNSKESADKHVNPTALIEKKIHEVLNKLANNSASVEETLWLKNVYRAVTLKKQFPKAAPRTWQGTNVMLAMACIILGGMLLFFRVGDIPALGFLSTNNVSIQVRCKALQVSLVDSAMTNIMGTDGSVFTDQLELNKLSMVTVSDTKLSFYDTISGLNAKLRNDTIFLDEIELGEASVVKIRPLKDMIYITTNGNLVRVTASFNTAEFLEPVKEKVHSSDIPLFARFESNNNKGSEVNIKFRHNGLINLLEGRRINSLLFSDSYVYGADILKYMSTIQSGKLTLHDVNRSIDLNKQDRFILQKPEGWIIDCSVENGVIDLFFKGTVRDIKAGPDGSEKDMSPRLLEYVYKNQPLSLFWGSVVFLWGLLSSIISQFKKT